LNFVPDASKDASFYVLTGYLYSNVPSKLISITQLSLTIDAL
jgi:hypothetical protein